MARFGNSYIHGLLEVTSTYYVSERHKHLASVNSSGILLLGDTSSQLQTRGTNILSTATGTNEVRAAGNAALKSTGGTATVEASTTATLKGVTSSLEGSTKALINSPHYVLANKRTLYGTAEPTPSTIPGEEGMLYFKILD